MKFKRESKEKNESRIRAIEETLKNPRALIPDCLDRGMFCPFTAYEKKLSGQVDLLKFSKSHDEFLRGLGETTRAINDDDLSFSGLLKTPHGTATFFKKGDTDQYVLAGIQNGKHDVFRMLAFSKIVLSGKSVIYSAGSYYRATCKSTPPEGLFLENLLNEEGVEYLKNTDGIIEIGDCEDYFEILIFGSVMVRVSKLSKIHTIVRIQKYLLCKNPMNVFSFYINSLSKFSHKGEEELFLSYISGNITDSDFYSQILSGRKNLAKQSGLFIIGTSTYPNINAFLQALELNLREIEAIESLWPGGEGIYLDDKSRRKLYETLWPEIGEQIVDSLYPGLRENHKDVMKGNPLEILDRIEKAKRLEETEKDMHLDPWSEASKQIADLIVIGISEKPDDIADYISKMNMGTGDSQAVAYCFQEIYKITKAQSWKISQDAEVKGRMLITYVKQILDKSTKDTNSVFQDISKLIR
jgi:hypothetical protein